MGSPEFLNIDITFDLKKESDYNCVDPAIRSLVMVMNDMDIPTDASCQGHLQKGRNPYPWIGTGGDIGFTGTKRRKRYDHFIDLVQQFRSEDGITWRFYTNMISPSIKHIRRLERKSLFSNKSKEEKLQILQNSAQELAKFLKYSQMQKSNPSE